MSHPFFQVHAVSRYSLHAAVPDLGANKTSHTLVKEHERGKYNSLLFQFFIFVFFFNFLVLKEWNTAKTLRQKRYGETRHRGAEWINKFRYWPGKPPM
jgi:hypothetical protein